MRQERRAGNPVGSPACDSATLDAFGGGKKTAVPIAPHRCLCHLVAPADRRAGSSGASISDNRASAAIGIAISGIAIPKVDIALAKALPTTTLFPLVQAEKHIFPGDRLVRSNNWTHLHLTSIGLEEY